MTYVSWVSDAKESALETIIPDGCRDVIVVRRHGIVETAFISSLDLRPRTVQMHASQTIHGYRLQPGLVIGHGELADFLLKDEFAQAEIANASREHTEAMGLVDLLAQTGQTIASVARTAGVSERSLQRYFKLKRLPRPEVWRMLGRARRAAGIMRAYVSLAELAHDFGYSDQAHLTREFSRWFGASPARLRQQPGLLAQVCQPGLGNWTGEQISIR